MNLQERVEVLEKKVAELEGQIQVQPNVEDIAKNLITKISEVSKSIT